MDMTVAIRELVEYLESSVVEAGSIHKVRDGKGASEAFGAVKAGRLPDDGILGI